MAPRNPSALERILDFLRGEYFRTVLVYPIIFYVAYIAANSWIFGMHFLESGDEAANALQIERARHFRELLGPYSRFQFHHPGPVSHYFLAWMESLFPWAASLYAKHALAQSLLNLLFFVSTMHVFYRATTDKWCTYLFALALLLVSTAIGVGMPLMVWGPAMIVLPMALFGISSAVFAGGRARALLPMVVGAVFAVHNHVGALSLLGPVALVSFILFFRNGGVADFKNAKIPLAAAAAFLILTSIPPLIEQFQDGGGNISRLVRFILYGGAAHRFDKSVLFISGYFARPLALNVPIVGLVIAILVIALASRQWKAGGFEKRVFIISLTAFGAAILGAIRVTGSFGDFLFWMFYPYVAMLYTCALLTLIRFIPTVRIPRNPLRIAAAAAVFLAAITLYRVQQYDYDDTAEKLSAFLHRTTKDRTPVYRLEWKAEGDDLGQWVFAAGLLLIVDRAGGQACVLEPWEFMFPRDFSCKGKSVSHRLVFRTIDNTPEPRESADRISFRRTEMVVVKN